jgi:voltage-gated potassium channel
LANSVNNADHPESKLVLINYVKNRPYGTFIDRGSKVTIVSTSGHTEPATGWLAYHIAKLGVFNYIAKEIESDMDNPTSYYNIPDSSKCPNLPLFIEDLRRLADRPGSWVIPILEATGLRSRPTQFHFCYNSTKHDASYNDPTSLVKDYATFDTLYNHMEQTLKEKFDYNCDKNEWYAIGKQNIGHRITASNVFTLRIEAFVWIFDSRWGLAVKTIADCFHEILEPERPVEIPYEMAKRQEGHDFGMQDYVD